MHPFLPTRLGWHENMPPSLPRGPGQGSFLLQDLAILLFLPAGLELSHTIRAIPRGANQGDHGGPHRVGWSGGSAFSRSLPPSLLLLMAVAASLVPGLWNWSRGRALHGLICSRPRTLFGSALHTVFPFPHNRVRPRLGHALLFPLSPHRLVDASSPTSPHMAKKIGHHWTR